MYEVYLGEMLCPVTPSKITMKIKNQNKTMNLINDGEINFLKQPGLTEVNFELLLPNVEYPKSIARYDSGFKNAQYFLDILEDLKVSKKPFRFKVTRTLPNGKILYNSYDTKESPMFSLEEYDIVEDAKEGFDVKVSVKLKQFKEFGTKLVKIISEEEGVASVEKNRSTANSPEPTSSTSYTVVSGDSLWNIAKKFYGDGSKYPAIFEANKDKITNANSIYPGQVLTIPGATEAKASVASTSGGKKTGGTTTNGSSYKHDWSNKGWKFTVHNNNQLLSSACGEVVVTYYDVNNKYTRLVLNSYRAIITAAEGTKVNVSIKKNSGYKYTAIPSGNYSKANKENQVVYTFADAKTICELSINWRKA